MSQRNAAADRPGLLEDVPDLGTLPAQAEELTRAVFSWVRDDSLGALLGMAVGVGFYLLLLVGRGWARRRLARHATFGSWNWVALKVAARTRSFFLVAIAAKLVVELFAAPAPLAGFVTFLFTIAAALQGAFWAREFLIALVERKSAEREEADGTLSSAVGVLTVIINVIVWSIAGIILLDNLGVNVTGLVAGLGVGGIAIGLAAQGIFSDLFAALSILLDRPFKVGDTIQVGGPTGIIGTVEHIGLKTTRLRALSGEIVVLSNAGLLNQQINNFADFSHRRVVLLIEVIYQTETSLLQRIPAELADIVNGVPRCRFDRAHLFQFAASALDYELVFIVEDPGLEPMFEARQAVMIAIIERFRALDIDFAFPSQTSFLAGPDGRIVVPESGVEPVRKAARRRPGSAGATAG
jgi:small-conductance mechanosensitive channel